MKLFVIALVLISAAAVLADEDADWLQFKMKFGKMFLSKGKEEKRKQAFKANKAVHDELKAAAASGEIAFEPAIYAFHDLEPEEMLARMTGLEAVEDSSEDVEVEVPESRQALERNYDSKVYLGAVRNQKSCGSCWTFSTMSAIEAGYAKKYGSSVDLSEQQLVDCAKRDSSNNALDGCQGGWMPSAFYWLSKNGGAVEEYLYPYNAVWSGSCGSGKPTKVSVSGYTQIASDETSIKNAIKQYGSLAVAVDASKWGYYGTGIFSASSVGSINHAVNLVGWGYDDALGQAYWLIRNSWGPTWGESGYIRVSTSSLGTYFPQHTYAVQLAY